MSFRRRGCDRLDLRGRRLVGTRRQLLLAALLVTAAAVPARAEPKLCGAAWFEASKDRVGLRATIALDVGGSPPPMHLLVANSESGKEVTLLPSRLAPYIEAGSPLALVVLVQGNYRWMGEREYRDDDRAYVGGYGGLREALPRLATVGVKGSRAALVTYGIAARVNQPLGDPGELVTALGEQKDYAGIIGASLTAGLAEAYQLLTWESDARRILIVIGDGFDLNEGLTGELDDARRRLEELDTEIYTLRYESTPAVSEVGARNLQKLGYSGAWSADMAATLSPRIEEIKRLIQSRYAVEFTGEALQSRGDLDLYLVVDGDQLEVRTRRPPPARPASRESSTWWIVAASAGALLALLLAGLFLLRKERG